MALPLSPTILEAFEKKLEKWAADDSTAKMVVCQTVTLEIHSEIADLPTAREMWEYLERRYCGSSQTQLYTLYQALSGLQQGEDIVNHIYSRFCGLWLRPEFEQTRAQLLHAPFAYSLNEAFAFVRAEETRLRSSFIGGPCPRCLAVCSCSSGVLDCSSSACSP